MELSQLCAANYHYKRYTLDYFLESAERLGYQSIELWASIWRISTLPVWLS
jgi:protein FrlC